LVDVEEDDEHGRLIRRMTAFRKVGRHYRRSEEIHELQLYSRREIARELRNVGFRVTILNAYGEQCLPRGVFGFTALKPN
jgi:hypothetical protein